MINHTLQKIILLRFWRFFLQTYLIVSLIWAFSIGVKLFIRQEIYSPKILAILTMTTLPSILPYITCVAAMFTIINLGKTHELNLITLMGISRRSRFIHLWLILLTMPLFMFAFEGFIKPHFKTSMKSPVTFLSKKQLEHLPPGTEIQFQHWLYSKTENKKVLLFKHEEKNTTSIMSDSIHFSSDQLPQLLANNGFIWPNHKKPDQNLQFKQIRLPISDQSSRSTREKLFTELDSSIDRELQQKLLVIRNAFAPIFLIYLGVALGYYTLISRKSWGFILCLFIMLAVYFPCYIIGRKLTDDFNFTKGLSLLLPFVVVSIIAHLLNRFAEKRGCP